MSLILVSCSAQLGVMPLSLYYFKQFSGLFLVSSILLLPGLGVTLIFGYSVLAASVIFDAQLFVYQAFQAWLELMTMTIEWLGNVDELIFAGVYFPFSFLVLMSSSLLFLTMGFLKRKTVLIFASCICLSCMQVIWVGHRTNVLRVERLLVFHKRGESLVVRRKGPVLEVKKYDLNSRQLEMHLEDYSSRLPGNFSIQHDRERTLLPIRFFYAQKSLVCVIDQKIDLSLINALGSLNRNPDIVIFSNAPSFNLERLLRKIRPGIVVADGSNHRGFVRRCRATCQSLGIEFHGTYEKGAFLYPK